MRGAKTYNAQDSSYGTPFSLVKEGKGLYLQVTKPSKIGALKVPGLRLPVTDVKEGNILTGTTHQYHTVIGETEYRIVGVKGQPRLVEAGQNPARSMQADPTVVAMRDSSLAEYFPDPMALDAGRESRMFPAKVFYGGTPTDGSVPTPAVETGTAQLRAQANARKARRAAYIAGRGDFIEADGAAVSDGNVPRVGRD